MKFTWLTTGRNRGVIIDTKRRAIMFGIGYDRTRKWAFGATKFKLVYSKGLTGNFGIGKLWFWYGTWLD